MLSANGDLQRMLRSVTTLSPLDLTAHALTCKNVPPFKRVFRAPHNDRPDLLPNFDPKSTFELRVAVHAHRAEAPSTPTMRGPHSLRRNVHRDNYVPECARLFLEDKYAIGQLFRTLGTAPKFALLKIGTGEGNSDGFKGAQKHEQGHSTKLWRKYTLDVEGVACEITEVFPDRELFIHPEEWLSKQPVQHSSRRSSQAQRCLDSSEGPLGS